MPTKVVTKSRHIGPIGYHIGRFSGKDGWWWDARHAHNVQHHEVPTREEAELKAERWLKHHFRHLLKQFTPDELAEVIKGLEIGGPS